MQKLILFIFILLLVNNTNAQGTMTIRNNTLCTYTLYLYMFDNGGTCGTMTPTSSMTVSVPAGVLVGTVIVPSVTPVSATSPNESFYRCSDGNNGMDGTFTDNPMIQCIYSGCGAGCRINPSASTTCLTGSNYDWTSDIVNSSGTEYDSEIEIW
jgi:hypothetical protein